MSHDLLIENLFSIWWIILAAMLAPIFALITRKYIPDVIWLLVFGIIIGPHLLGVAKTTESVEILREIGMGFLFMLAGFEVNTADMKSRQGKQAFLTWMICFSLVVGIGILFTKGEIDVALVLAIATTSTALGTLLPMLKDSNMLESPLGKATIIHGAYGELLPIVAMSLLLSTLTPWQASIILIIFTISAIIVVITPVSFIRRLPLLGRAIVSASNTTMQTTLRITVFILVTLMLLTAILKLDIAMGAFLAGILLNSVLGTFSPKHKKTIENKIEVVGFSFLIPVFFITSGMNINLFQVLSKWHLLFGLVIFILIVRGAIVFSREVLFNTHSNLTLKKEQIALGLYSASGLPIIVAVTDIAESSNIINQFTSSTMVTSGAITVLIFPLIAKIILKNSK